MLSENEMSQIFDMIWSSENLKDEDHLNDLRNNFLQRIIETSGNIEKVDKILSENPTSELHRIQTLEKYFTWNKIPSAYFERYSKNSTLAKRFLLKSDEEEENGNIEKAVRGFTLALMFSQPKSPEWFRSLYHRGEALHRVRKPEESLKDFSLALNTTGCPEDLKQKLELSSYNVFSKLGSESKPTNETSRGLTRTDKEANKTFCENNIFKIHNYNAKTPCAASSVGIGFEEYCGRLLYALQDIQPGEVLQVQKPYVCTLKDALRWDTWHCHNCCRAVFHSIPCSQCVFAVFCSEECQSQACSSHHQYEHGLLSYLSVTPVCAKDTLSIKILSALGPFTAYDLYKTKNPDLFQGKVKVKSFDVQAGSYSADSYPAIFTLVSHGYSQSISHRIANAFKAFVFTHALNQSSNFFTQHPQHKSVDFKTFVCALILRHLENIPPNMISISKLETSTLLSKPKLPVDQIQSQPYGLALFSFLSLANHSCSPNAIPLRHQNNLTISLIATEPIKSGQQIFISYFPTFENMAKWNRQQFLLLHHHFTCLCQACIEDWEVSNSSASLSQANNAQSAQQIRSQMLQVFQTTQLLEAYKFQEAFHNLKDPLKQISTLHPTDPCFLDLKNKLKLVLVNLVSSYI